MFANRLVNIMLVILVTVTLIGVIALVVITQFLQPTSADGEPTIDEVIELNVETEEITTNLLSNDIIRSKFVIQLDAQTGKDEFEKRDYQIENIIIQELSDRKASDFNGSSGILDLEEHLKRRFNEVMQSGEVVDVYMRERVIQ
ncbi:flagellar basal body-associated protein FliL [Alteribacter populi]|uniref:flagellar basal body-associated protein FliL n=1 Tax=Alteribacter populi TaxID=2011011 RepID=UPI000BBB3C81|nr:flagellar basal body-associated protein FliL [Alteribacter populi]